MSGAPLLPVPDIGTTVSSKGERLPTAVINTAQHPEALPEAVDLARVHAKEGIGFALPAHRRVLDDAVTTGQPVLATTNPTRAADQPDWLAITINGPRLTAVRPSETK